jgi:hypothetical protein
VLHELVVRVGYLPHADVKPTLSSRAKTDGDIATVIGVMLSRRHKLLHAQGRTIAISRFSITTLPKSAAVVKTDMAPNPRSYNTSTSKSPSMVVKDLSEVRSVR